MASCDSFFFFFQAEDGIRDQPRSRGLGDVYKRQVVYNAVSKTSRLELKRVYKSFTSTGAGFVGLSVRGETSERNRAALGHTIDCRCRVDDVMWLHAQALGAIKRMSSYFRAIKQRWPRPLQASR